MASRTELSSGLETPAEHRALDGERPSACLARRTEGSKGPAEVKNVSRRPVQPNLTEGPAECP
jgi:hypothetical protein